MGCSGSTESFEVIYTKLVATLEENIYEIQYVAKETLQKKPGVKLLNQVDLNENETIQKFLDSPNFVEKTIVYFYLRDLPIIKTVRQSLDYIPENFPSLIKIIFLSTEELKKEIPKSIIEKMTTDLQHKKFIGFNINLNIIQKNIIEAQNPNLTKDSFDINESENENDNESMDEKDDEILITEELTKQSLSIAINKLKADPSSKIIQTTAASHENGNEINSNIKTIKIINTKFSNISLFLKLLNIIKESTSIRKFCFYENAINSDFEGWESLTQYIDSNYSLRYLDLHSSNLYDFQLSSIIRAISDKRLRVLNLSENFITVDGVKELVVFLQSNKTLQKLNLCRNAQCQFKAEGVKVVVNALEKHTNIQLLDFSFMNLTGCGEFIGNFLKNNKSIQSISLANTQLNFVDFKNIFNELKNNFILKEIDVSFNDMGGDKSLQLIGEAIKCNKTLNTIKLEQMNINNDNYSLIFDAIKQNKNINKYCLSYNSNIKPKIVLNFFMEQKQVKSLEYIPLNPDNDKDKKKELTLEEKKLFEKFKTGRPDMEFVYK